MIDRVWESVRLGDILGNVRFAPFYSAVPQTTNFLDTIMGERRLGEVAWENTELLRGFRWQEANQFLGTYLINVDYRPDLAYIYQAEF